jgi:transposase
MAYAMMQTDASRTTKETTADVARGWRNGSRRYFTVEQKQAVLAECSAPGATLSGVALKHGLNANMVRKWVVRAQAGTLAVKRGRKSSMIPIVLTAEADACDDASDSKRRAVRVEIETPRGVMRVSGEVDGAMLSTLLTAMMGR